MKFYYNRVLKGRYKSIGNVRISILGDTAKKEIEIQSNGEDISEHILRKDSKGQFTIMSSPNDEILELVLDAFVNFMDCGFNSMHHDTSGSPKPIKMIDGKVKDFLTIDKFTNEEIEKIYPEIDEEFKKGVKSKQKVENYDKVVIDSESLKQEVEQIKEELITTKKIFSDEWSEVIKSLSKGVQTPEEEQQFSESIKKVSSTDKETVDERAKQLIDFLNGIPIKAFDSFIQKEKFMAKELFTLINESSEEVKLLLETERAEALNKL